MQRSPLLPFELLRLANLAVRELGSVTESRGVTVQQAAVLLRLEEIDSPPTLVALARALSVSKQSVTAMVARMEESGLVVRSGDPDDGRLMRVGLTPKGGRLAEVLRPLLERASKAWMSPLDAAERQSLHTAVAVLLED